MANFIGENEISPASICTDFPNVNGFQYSDLTLADSSFRSKNEIQDCDFLWYSNVFNGFSDQELEEIKEGQKWQLLKKTGSWPVRMELYQRKRK